MLFYLRQLSPNMCQGGSDLPRRKKGGSSWGVMSGGFGPTFKLLGRHAAFTGSVNRRICRQEQARRKPGLGEMGTRMRRTRRSIVGTDNQFVLYTRKILSKHSHHAAFGWINKRV